MAQPYYRRITAPSTLNRYYIKRNNTWHGYNRCILINEENGSVLPNCTGYAWGRYCEEQGITDCKLSRANAELWYGNTSDGYQRGLIPKLGAVICWHSTRSGGHVAIVEKINYFKRTIETTNSAYNGKTFYTRTLSMDNNYYMGSAYTFQGFIYPDVEFYDGGEPIPPTPQIETKKHKFKWAIFTKKLRNRRLTE